MRRSFFCAVLRSPLPASPKQPRLRINRPKPPPSRSPPTSSPSPPSSVTNPAQPIANLTRRGPPPQAGRQAPNHPLLLPGLQPPAHPRPHGRHLRLPARLHPRRDRRRQGLLPRHAHPPRPTAPSSSSSTPPSSSSPTSPTPSPPSNTPSPTSPSRTTTSTPTPPAAAPSSSTPSAPSPTSISATNSAAAPWSSSPTAATTAARSSQRRHRSRSARRLHHLLRLLQRRRRGHRRPHQNLQRHRRPRIHRQLKDDPAADLRRNRRRHAPRIRDRLRPAQIQTRQAPQDRPYRDQQVLTVQAREGYFTPN